MKMHFVLAGLLVALAVCAAGCTQTGSTGNATATPVTTGAATSAATASVVQTTAAVTTSAPAALEALPAGQELSIQVNRDPLNRDVTVIFNGGRGQGSVRAMEVTVTRSDGTTETKSLDIRAGSEAVFKGTRGTDTVSVKARMTNGRTYRFFEQSIK